MSGKFMVTWQDAGREPKVAPNPDYPNGVDVDASGGAELTCKVTLPYPAKRIGFYSVICQICGHTSVTTTAGRADDPRSVTVACKIAGGSKQ